MKECSIFCRMILTRKGTVGGTDCHFEFAYRTHRITLPCLPLILESSTPAAGYRQGLEGNLRPCQNVSRLHQCLRFWHQGCFMLWAHFSLSKPGFHRCSKSVWITIHQCPPGSWHTADKERGHTNIWFLVPRQQGFAVRTALLEVVTMGFWLLGVYPRVCCSKGDQGQHWQWLRTAPRGSEKEKWTSTSTRKDWKSFAGGRNSGDRVSCCWRWPGAASGAEIKPSQST